VLYAPNAMVFHCVPKERTTFDFIKKQALGTGISERIRSKNEGLMSYIKRITNECIKWIGSIVLWFRYAFFFAISQRKYDYFLSFLGNPRTSF